MTLRVTETPALATPSVRPQSADRLAFPPSVTFIAGTLGQGGAERQLYYMVKALRAQDVRVRVLCLTRGEFWEERIRSDLGVPVVWVGQSPARWRRIIRIVRELKREPATVVQSAHFFTNLYALVAARFLGSHEVGAIRNDVTSEMIMGWFGRLSLTGPRLLAANSRAGAGKAQALGVAEARCVFLPNVVDTDRFRPQPRLVRPELRLLAVGRLVAQKRFDRLLRVIAAVRRQSTDSESAFKVSIIGAGPLQKELQQQTQELGLAHIVDFKGVIPNVAPEYAQADLLVLTSDWEGTPNVILEAMASGLPVVATPVGGINEVVCDGVNGLIAADEAGLVQAVARLIANPAERSLLGRNARFHVEAHHSTDSLPQSLAALYGAIKP